MIWTSDDVVKHMKKQKKKVSKEAPNVKCSMDKNAEILIEGTIPSEFIK